MMRFKVLGGTHKEAGRTYHKGDIVQSEHELDKMFSNKFERLENAAHSPPSLIGGEAGEPASPADPLFAEFGNDVTGIVDHRLYEAGLQVRHKAGWFSILDADGTLIGDRKFRRKDLTEYLDAYFENG